VGTTISEQNTEHGTGTVAHVIQFSTHKKTTEQLQHTDGSQQL